MAIKPEIVVKLPVLHADQVKAFKLREDARGLDENRTDREEWLANTGKKLKVVRCGRRWGKCIASGELVAMADGACKAIEDVRPGEMVWAVDESSLSVVARRVLALHDNGVRDLVEVRTTGGRVLCTPHHRIFTASGWVEARDLIPGKMIASLRDGCLSLEELASIKPWGSGPTWDLSVEADQNFFVDGIMVHNTALGATIASDAATKGYPVGWFAPDHKTMGEVYQEIHDLIEPVKKTSSQNAGVIRTISDGRLDFWSLDNERAGRSRKYKVVLIDEAAFTKPNMIEIWERSIKPTLLDYGGSAWVLSNTNGVSEENFMWQICNQPKHGFIEYHAPSWNNPTIPFRNPGETDDELAVRRMKVFEDIKAREHPLVFAQEYGAEFVDWSGVAFFSQDKMLDDGRGWRVPTKCDYVFATMDTAVKTGKKNDGTAVTYWARNQYDPTLPPLIVLDWDIVQIEGDLLESWMPNVFARLDELSRDCGARMGSAGVHIEDKATGMVLIMALQRKGMAAHAIDSKMTSVGKDERAIAVSGYVHRAEVGITQDAFDKVTRYKGVDRNHFLAQVCGFRIGVENTSDDLSDTFCYGILIALGDGAGI